VNGYTLGQCVFEDLLCDLLASFVEGDSRNSTHVPSWSEYSCPRRMPIVSNHNLQFRVPLSFGSCKHQIDPKTECALSFRY